MVEGEWRMPLWLASETCLRHDSKTGSAYKTKKGFNYLNSHWTKLFIAPPILKLKAKKKKAPKFVDNELLG